MQKLMVSIMKIKLLQQHILMKSVLTLLLLLGVNNAWALVCKPTAVNNGLNYYTVRLEGFNPPPFNPDQFAVGQTFYTVMVSQTVTNSTGTAYIQCTGDGAVRKISTGVGTANAQNVYPTSISGIGIRFSQGTSVWPFESYWMTSTGIEKGWYHVDTTAQFLKVELVKIGNITNGGLLQGAYGRIYAGTQLLAEYRWDNPISIRPNVPSCAVDNVTVSMPTASIKDFSGVSSYAGTTPFNISLNCSGGAVDSYANIYATLTDTVTPGNVSNILSLTPTSGAKGIGIQILKDGSVLSYGPDSSAPGNTGQWFVKNVTQGTSSSQISLSARYIKTAETITPGLVSAVATITLSYQ